MDDEAGWSAISDLVLHVVEGRIHVTGIFQKCGEDCIASTVEKSLCSYERHR